MNEDVTFCVPVDWTVTGEELRRCLDAIQRLFPLTRLIIFDQDGRLETDHKDSEEEAVGWASAIYNDSSVSIFRAGGPTICPVPLGIVTSSLVVVIRPWMELVGGEWLDVHREELIRAESQTVLVGGWGNPDFIDDAAQVYGFAQSWAEPGFCQTVSDGIWTARTEALQSIYVWPSHQGAVIHWITAALRLQGGAIILRDSGAVGHPHSEAYTGQWLSEYELLQAFPLAFSPRRAESEVRYYMMAGRWPEAFSELPSDAGTEAEFVSLAQTLDEADRANASERFDLFRRLCRYPRELALRLHHKGAFKAPLYGGTMDCLGRAEVLPGPRPQFETCIVAVASEGYEEMTLNAFETCRTYGGCSDVGYVVFAVDRACEAFAHIPWLTVIPCRSHSRPSPALKGLIYSAGRFIDANCMISIEADMVFVGSLQPLRDACRISSPRALLLARAGSQHCTRISFGDILTHSGERSDLPLITGPGYSVDAFDDRIYYGAGLIAGCKEAWVALADQLEAFAPWSWFWLQGGFDKPYGDEWLMNLALHSHDFVCEISGEWNILVTNAHPGTWFTTEETQDTVRLYWRDRPARVLHFISQGKDGLSHIHDLLRRKRLIHP